MQMLINIDVPELESAIEFYRHALGLNLARIIDGDVAEMSGAGAPIYLMAHRAGSAPAKSVAGARRYHRHWTPVHIDFVVKDIAQAKARARAAGATCESDCVEWCGSTCVTFSNPFGPIPLVTVSA